VIKMTNTPTNTPTIKQKIESGKFFSVPGIQDMISAVMAKSMGFDAVYASGYWMGASAYGVPDVGITTYTQMLDRVGTLVKTMQGTAAVIADADTGYGGLLNMRETVRGYEAAGVQVIQIEDQEFPKKCGHTRNKRVVPIDTMVRKIQVALEAATSPNTLIAARTDARQGEGFEGAMRRMEAYAAAGADILFPEALLDENEMREMCSAIKTPMMINMADGGSTPIMTADVLADLGYAFAIFPAATSLAAAEAVKQVLSHIKQTGSSAQSPVPMFDFNEFCSLIGFEDVWEFERRWVEPK
jgi:2-methylisocitrate lyase-like PEP mutase family enzyme